MAPRSLCLTTALAPVPAFLRGSCPSGCSLSAPATRGLSMVSPQYIRYAAGSEKEKRADRRLHGGTIAQSFLFCKRGVAGGLTWTECPVAACALLQRKVWLGMGRYPARPALRRFWKQGDSLYPRRGRSPLHPAWRTEASAFAHLARWDASAGVGVGIGWGFPGEWGLVQRFPGQSGARRKTASLRSCSGSRRRWCGVCSQAPPGSS